MLGVYTKKEKKMAFSLPERATKYPYAKWTDGEVHRAEQGKDFYCSTAGFINAIRRKAGRMGVLIEIRSCRTVMPNVVEFQFMVPSKFKAAPKKLVTTAKRKR